MSRRSFLNSLAWLPRAPASPAGGSTLHSTPSPIPNPDLLAPFLRPPGALAEAAFVAACHEQPQCDACMTACSHQSIRPLGPAYAAAATPAILPGSQPCYLCEGLPCAAACPTGALRVVDLHEVDMGQVQLDSDRCWLVLGQPCDYCVVNCPVEPSAMSWGDDRPIIAQEKCVGCGVCQYFCTAVPSALNVIPSPSRSVS